jgi:hypothetical protein
VPDFTDGTPLDKAAGLDTGRAALVSWLRERGARGSQAKPTVQIDHPASKSLMVLPLENFDGSTRSSESSR